MADLGSTRIYGDLVVTGEIKTRSSGGSGDGILEPVGHEIKMGLGKGESYTFTPPPGSRVLIKEMFVHNAPNKIVTNSSGSIGARLKRNNTLFLDTGGGGEYPTRVVGHNAPVWGLVNNYLVAGARIGHSSDSRITLYDSFLLSVDETFTIEVDHDPEDYVDYYITIIVNYVK